MIMTQDNKHTQVLINAQKTSYKHNNNKDLSYLQ